MLDDGATRSSVFDSVLNVFETLHHILVKFIYDL